MESSDEEEGAIEPTSAPLPFLFRRDKARPPVLVERSKSQLSDDFIEIWRYPDNGKLEFRVVSSLPLPAVPPPRPPRVPPPAPPPGPPPQLSRRQPPDGSPPAPKKKLCG